MLVSHSATGLDTVPSRSLLRTIVPTAIAAAVLIALAAHHFSPGIDVSARGQILRFVPADATSVFFVDFDELRGSPFLSALYSWAPQPREDSEYAQFAREIGFRYDRDLSKAFVAIANHGEKSSTLVLAEGRLDRAKIETYLAKSGSATQQGNLKAYLLPTTANEKPLYVALISAQRIVITNDRNLFLALSDEARQPSRAEWETRFERLAGSPAFAVVRQDPSVQAMLGSVAPGGYRSPQLAALINQLQWISIAAKLEGDALRLVADGESSSEGTASQLRDFLQGILQLAQDGLNDPKLRQQMKPEEREAYLDVLKSADVQKIDRGDWKSVRLVFSITPQFLAATTAAVPAAPAKVESDKPSASKTAPRPSRSAKKN